MRFLKASLSNSEGRAEACVWARGRLVPLTARPGQEAENGARRETETQLSGKPVPSPSWSTQGHPGRQSQPLRLDAVFGSRQAFSLNRGSGDPAEPFPSGQSTQDTQGGLMTSRAPSRKVAQTFSHPASSPCWAGSQRTPYSITEEHPHQQETGARTQAMKPSGSAPGTRTCFRIPGDASVCPATHLPPHLPAWPLSIHPTNFP